MKNLLIHPPFLKAGSKVGIIAPAKKVSSQEMAMAIQILEGWGLEVILGQHLYKVYNQFAGTDKERTEDLQNMLDHPEVEAIICARGGYGTVRVVDKLNFTKFSKSPKWLVGFSDITVLHCHVHNLGIESIHGIMPLLFPKQTNETIKSLYNALLGTPLAYKIPSHPLNKTGHTQGQLIGGNLSLFANTIGTSSEVETQGKILFLEDVNEYLYHLDRMMLHLYRAGKLKDLAGLVVGQFSEVKDNEIAFGQTVNEIIARIIQEYDYPVCYDFPVGHEVHNLSLPCGRIAELKIDTQDVVLAC